MKDHNWRQKELFILIVVILLIFVSPVVQVLASPDGQTVPTPVPDTDTPTIALIPSITQIPSITNTETKRPPSPATSTSTPSIAFATLNPTKWSAAQTATFLAGNPTASVTITPIPPTVTLSTFTTTSTIVTATTTSTTIATTQTVIVTSQGQPTPTLQNSNPGQNTFDNESFLLGIGSLLIILAVYIWSRGRNKGTGSK
ncbi:MAG TPA: hypothetical protein VMS73_09230 [Anaerolineaceae bacterium]|nr:hypothetical protein [Anaerolineaceae bacterium]